MEEDKIALERFLLQKEKLVIDRLGNNQAR